MSKAHASPALTRHVDTPLADFPLSTILKRAIKQHDITTIRELASLTEAEFLRMPKCGRQALAEARGLLAAHHLHLGTLFEDDA